MDPSKTFDIPLHFDALFSPEAGAEYDAVCGLLSSSPDDLLAQAEDGVCGSTSSFYALYTLASRWSRLSAKQRASTWEALRAHAMSVCGHGADAAKRAAFLLVGAVSQAEADGDGASRRLWDRSGGRDGALEAARALVDAAFPTPDTPAWLPADRAQLAATLLRLALAVVASSNVVRDKHARPAVARLLSAILSLDPAQALPATAGLVHVLTRNEFAGPIVAEVLAGVADSNAGQGTSHTAAGASFVGDVVVEIARMDSDDLSRDTAAAKACASCIGDLAEHVPRVVLSKISLLLGLLDGESYSMRNGILHALGRLACALRDDPAQADTRDSLLEILLDRALRDVHAFTRSKALQTWMFLAESRAIPHRMLASVATVACSRLDDKTAAVRRAAAQLLCALLQSNPFGPALRLSHFAAKLADVGGDPLESDETGSGESGDTADAQSESKAADNSDDSGSEISRTESDATDKEGTGDENESAAAGEDEILETSASAVPQAVEDDESDEQKRKRAYYKSSVEFIRAVESGLEKAYQLLRSTSITDVSESVNLLVTAVQFQLEAASGRAVRAMLVLVLAKEGNVKATAIDAYQVLLAPNSPDGEADDKASALLVANGLIALVSGATTGEVTCVEALVENMMSRDPCLISPAVIAITWDMFAGKIPGATVEQRCAACICIGMFAAVKPETLQSRVHILEKVGLKSNEKSFVLWTCVALRKLPPGSDEDKTISCQLLALIEGNCELSAVEQALNAVYRLHPCPEEDVSAMVRQLTARVLKTPNSAPTALLSKLLLVVGHVAMKQLVRVEALASEIRKLAKKEEEEEAGAEAEKALEFAETEITLPSSLLGQFGPLARKITRDETAPDQLRASAVLCLAKLMCVKASFCEANLQLLFTVLERASQACVRANAITALGDLAFRFPNLVEPWSTRIYKALEDKDVRVRKNALMALTHLILNDMVKVKGQMVGLALRVLDTDQRIADLAQVFFHELSRKSANSIYNLLPDTISCLSRRSDVSTQNIKKVMSFLIGFIEKGWQAEGVVDKLCQRFRTADREQEPRYIAYCISQINLTERCLNRLVDSFKLYAAALADDDVYQFMTTAVLRARKAIFLPGAGTSKKHSEGNQAADASEGKHRADELLERMERQRSGNDEDGNVEAAS